MRFEASAEERLFAESVSTAVAGWEAAREPEFGIWLDDRDDSLAERLAAAGWTALWADDDLLGAAVAGGLELGRAVAPVCLVDEATLGGVLCVSGRARHGVGAARLAVALPGEALALVDQPSTLAREQTLDGSGTVRVDVVGAAETGVSDAQGRWRAWTAVTLACLAGLAAEALRRSVEHARAREQFGSSLASLPAVQLRLADASLAVDQLELVAHAAAERTGGLDPPALLWAGDACCAVTASAHQIHGAIGFALESGLHRFHRRAKALQAWTAAVCAATR
jgi:alkylation response protein AidB-like acyl-CoA dehydrogenase